MKYFYILCLSILASLQISAQTRLHTTSGMWIAKSQERQLIINTVFDTDCMWYPGFIEDGSLPIRGFYIDEEASTIHYSQFGLNYDEKWEAEDIVKHEMAITAEHANALSELIRLAVCTSSPQNNRFGDDGTTYYFVYHTDIADSYSPMPPSMQSTLVEVCKTVLEVCEKNDESLIDTMSDTITELISTYRSLLNFDFSYHIVPPVVSVGSLFSYLEVTAVFDEPFDVNNIDAYRNTLETIARYLVDRIFGPVNSIIEVSTSKEYKEELSDWHRITISEEDFTSETLLSIYEELLKRHQ